MKTTSIQISEYFQRSSLNSTLPLEFVTYDGYIALPSIMCSFHPGKNPLFGNITDCHQSTKLFNNINIDGKSKNLRYRKTRSWAGPQILIFSGYFTVIALPNEFDYMPSDILTNYYETEYRMEGALDIFCLGLVKITDLPNVYIPRKRSITTEINTASMKIIVSTEKLRKTRFTRENYTKTFRTEIIYQLERIQREYGITIEDVSDDYIQNFFRRPNVYPTTSITEAMQIDSQIKEGVFSKLNELVV